MPEKPNDPAASTQRFRAFVDEGTPSTPSESAASSKTGLIVVLATVAVLVLVAGAVLLLR